MVQKHSRQFLPASFRCIIKFASAINDMCELRKSPGVCCSTHFRCAHQPHIPYSAPVHRSQHSVEASCLASVTEPVSEREGRRAPEHKLVPAPLAALPRCGWASLVHNPPAPAAGRTICSGEHQTQPPAALSQPSRTAPPTLALQSPSVQAGAAPCCPQPWRRSGGGGGSSVSASAGPTCCTAAATAQGELSFA